MSKPELDDLISNFNETRRLNKNKHQLLNQDSSDDLHSQINEDALPKKANKKIKKDNLDQQF